MTLSTVEELMIDVNSAVMDERIRQNNKWGHQRHTLGAWLAILTEEVGEVATAVQGQMGHTSVKETDPNNLYEELIHVAAVASAFAEQVKEANEDGTD